MVMNGKGMRWRDGYYRRRTLVLELLTTTGSQVFSIDQECWYCFGSMADSPEFGSVSLAFLRLL